jgi:hypothetical protein
MLQKHLATLSTTLPKVDQVTSNTSSLSGHAESLSGIPSATTNSTSRFSRTPDTIWKLMFLVWNNKRRERRGSLHFLQDHQKVMNEFITTLNKMHEANQIVQEEATKLAQAHPSPSPAQPPAQPSSSSNPSFSIPVDKLHKSVSYAGVDTQYSPKEPTSYYSLPSTPKKVTFLFFFLFSFSFEMK